jgi:hypothetical protein
MSGMLGGKLMTAVAEADVNILVPIWLPEVSAEMNGQRDQAIIQG